MANDVLALGSIGLEQRAAAHLVNFVIDGARVFVVVEGVHVAALAYVDVGHRGAGALVAVDFPDDGALLRVGAFGTRREFYSLVGALERA